MQVLHTQIQWPNHILDAKHKKQNVELSNSPVKLCNLHPTIGKLLWF